MSEFFSALTDKRENILLAIFEGEKTEAQIFDSLKAHFPLENKHRVIMAAYGTEIYQLWQEIKQDEFVDTFQLIKERLAKVSGGINKKTAEELRGISRNQVSEIYLFFDYDGHATNSCDEHVQQMLQIFNNETELGKLYISYPMVEALKHVQRQVDFTLTTVEAKQNIAYKNLVNSNSDFVHFKRYQKQDWQFLFLQHISKAHYIVKALADKPEVYQQFLELSQEVIFAQQLQRYILPLARVAVLSGFPFFIIEYFGEHVWLELIND